MGWYPHYESLLIIPTDSALHDALTRSTTQSLTPVLRDLPADAIGDLDAPIFRLRKAAARNAKMATMESQDYRGILIRGGLVIGR